MSRRKNKNSSSFIPRNPSGFRWFVLLLALIVGIISIVYVQYLTKELKERERKQIRIYSKTLESFSNNQLDERVTFIFDEIIVNNRSIPVILTDEFGEPQDFKNIKTAEEATNEADKKRILYEELEVMRSINEPLLVTLKTPDLNVIGYRYVFYNNSFLLDQLTYFPYVQISLIFGLILIAFMMFNYSKTSEQNKVWAGLAKETAHQLGTPLSSLMAWNEYIKSADDFDHNEVSAELSKDIARLNLIAERFSNIGSVPVLKDTDPGEVIQVVVDYLGKRTSSKVSIAIDNRLSNGQKAAINRSLFEWVIENLIKNAVDAMSGKGNITIVMEEKDQKILIDLTDTGRGMSKSIAKKIFQAGFTTKQRGWGLGLTLAKRIIENYHNGKIIVKFTEIGVGTTFRISLKST